MLQKNGKKIRIFNEGPKPDTFKDQSEVVATGRLVKASEVQALATQMCAKQPAPVGCPLRTDAEQEWVAGIERADGEMPVEVRRRSRNHEDRHHFQALIRTRLDNETIQSVPFSPIAVVGTLALLAAFLTAAWAFAAGIAGNARKSRRLVNASVYGLYGFGALIGLASSLMIYAFVSHDFSLKYVAAASDTTMPTIYKVTAFWGGLDGSLLFWVLVLAIFSTIAIVVNAKRHRDMIGYVVATIMAVQLFFLSLLLFTKNPFATFLTTPPIDGQGLNPLLQNYWMVIHPPSLYTGFVAATIPFAFGIGALASGRLDDMWLGSVRVWMLICFVFLSLGLILGGRWAYEELGWGGYWAWDPVENAGLMPWFTATAFLHSAIIQEQRGTMKTWNISLVIITFFLTDLRHVHDALGRGPVGPRVRRGQRARAPVHRVHGGDPDRVDRPASCTARTSSPRAPSSTRSTRASSRSC